MIRVYFSPIFDFTGTHKLVYSFEGEKITVSYIKNGNEKEAIEDVFDFTGLPEGAMTMEHLETILPHIPITEAYRADGILYVGLLNFISETATDFEKFPNWVEVT